MRPATFFLMFGGAAAALAFGGLATAAQSTRDRSAELPVAEEAPASVSPPSDVDAERRALLSARMHLMVSEGRGGRLADPVVRTAARSSAREASRARPVAEPVNDRPESSTIRPPAYNPASAPARSSGGRYVAPRLDLKTAPVVPTDPVECLTQAVYYEARNESEEGQGAVAEVVMNRSRSGQYPQSVCAVVYQRNSRTCQFTFTCDGAIGRHPVDMRKWARAERIAREVYNGRSASLLPQNSVNYHADYVRPSWGARLERVRQIGAHIFYGASRNGRSTPGAATTIAERAPTERAPTRGLVFVRLPALEQASAPEAEGN